MLLYQCVLLTCIGFCLAIDLPPNYPRCFRDDPNLNDCLLKATETVKPLITHGVKEIDLPKLEPFVIPMATIEQGSNNLVFKVALTNLTLRGLSDYNFKYFNYNPETRIWDMEMQFKKLNIVSECDFDGKIIIAPIKGKGIIKIEQVKVVLNGKLVTRKKEQFYSLTNVTINFPVPKTSVRLEDFSGVRPDIIEVINDALAENSEELVTEFSSTLQLFLENFITSIYKGFFRNVQYKYMFPLKNTQT